MIALMMRERSRCAVGSGETRDDVHRTPFTLPPAILSRDPLSAVLGRPPRPTHNVSSRREQVEVELAIDGHGVYFITSS